jgi:fluoroquinolone transport system permease protein
MSALRTLIVNDMRLLWRTGFVVVSAIVIALFAWGVSRLTLPPAGTVADVVAAIALLLAVLTPLITVGIMLITERAEGVLASLAVTPAAPWQSILARTLVVAALSSAEMFVLFYFAFDDVRVGSLLPGLLSICSLSALFGVVAVAPHTSILDFVLPMAGWSLFLDAPAIGALFRIDAGWWVWHPMAPAQQIVAGAFGALDPRELAFGVAGNLVWIGLAGLLAARALARMRAPPGES